MPALSRRLVLTSAAALCAIGSAAHASVKYPTKPVTMIVATSPGSGPDVIARIVADRLSQSWGQQVTVMNKVGGFGSVALQAVTVSPADGHTLVVCIASTFIVWPEMQKSAAIELQREITPVGLLGVQPMIIAVNPTVGANTLGELATITHQRPDEILYGGVRGAIPHLTGARLASTGALKWRYIPSPAPRAIQDVMSGSMHGAIESLAALISPIQAGLLRGLAVTSASRLPGLPDLPTVREAVPELGDFQARGWVVLMARNGTPVEIVRKINEELLTMMANPDVVQRLVALGTYPEPLTPSETDEFIRREKDLWRPVVQSLDLATQ